MKEDRRRRRQQKKRESEERRGEEDEGGGDCVLMGYLHQRETHKAVCGIKMAL